MNSKYGYTKMVAIVGLCAVSAMAMAQGRGRGGPRMSPEESAKVWELEATVVAKALDLAEDAQAKVVDAFKAAREAQGEALREAYRAGGGDLATRMKATRELAQKHAESLKSSLSEAIGEDAGAKAAEQLAPLDRLADRLAQVLGELELEEVKLHESMGHVVAYASNLQKETEEAIANMDMEGMRSARRELKTTLDDALAKVLNAEQLASWKEKTEFRRRGGRGGRSGDNEN